MATRDKLSLDSDGNLVGVVHFDVEFDAQPIELEEDPEAGDGDGDGDEDDPEAEAEAAPDPLTPQSFDPETNEIDLALYTGTTVERFSFFGDRWLLTLSMDPSHRQRLGRLNARAPLANGHRTDTIDNQLGVTVPGTARIEGRRLLARYRLSPAPEDAGRIMKIATGIASNASVGVRIHKSEVTEATDSAPKHVLATDWEVLETSIVPIGADPGAGTLSAIAPQAIPEELPPEPAEDEGAAMSAEKLAAAEKAAAEKATLAERARLADIADHCERWEIGEDDRQKLVDGGKSGAELSKQVLDLVADRDEATAISPMSDAATSHVGAGLTNHQKRCSTIEEYVLHLGWPYTKNPETGRESGFKLTDGARQWLGYDLAMLTREDRRQRGLSWQGITNDKLETLAMRPITSEPPSDWECFSVGGGGMSPNDLPAAFGNIVNKVLQASFQEARTTSEAWTGKMVVSDYRKTEIIKLGSAPRLEEVGEDGEFKYGYFSDAKEEMWLLTGGKILRIGRRFQKDDPLQLMVAMPRAFGPATKDRRNRLVYKLVTGNEKMVSTGLPMFDEGHRNVIPAGSGVASDRATNESVFPMWELFRDQRDLPNPQEEGLVRVSLVPTFITHPSNQMLDWAKYFGPITPTEQANVVPGQFKEMRLLDEPLLGDDDPNKWYMHVDPATGWAAVVTATMIGQGDGPVTMWKMGWNPEGAEFKVVDDFGARPGEQRGAALNYGA